MYIAQHARSSPDTFALVMTGTGESLTYRELDENSNRLAHLMRDAGLDPGDHIAVFMENQPAFLEVCWAAERSGLYYTPVNSHLTAAEAAYIVNDCGARMLVASGHLTEAAKLPSLVTDVERLLMVRGAVPGYEDYELETSRYPAHPIPDERLGRGMLYSSGTTGQPKGVLRPLIDAELTDTHPVEALLRKLYDFDRGMVYLSPAPLYHAAPLGFSLAAQRVGGTVVVMDRFDAAGALAAIAGHAVTHSQWVPSMFSRLLKLDPECRARFDLSSLRYVIHSAAPCPMTVKEAMLDWLGPIVHEYYGTTEMNGMTAIPPHEWLAHRGSVGRAVIGDVRILDDDLRPVPMGVSGTVYFEGGAPFSYHNDPDRTASAGDGRGATTTGDVGYLDENGYLYLTDRRSDMIISGGVNIYPRESETILADHPDVADVAVFGVPDDDLGEIVMAAIQLHDRPRDPAWVEQRLLEYCRDKLARFKCPRSVTFVEELPRLATGKLDKRSLRRMPGSTRGFSDASRVDP